jgi:hypothetical protein
MTWTAAYTDIRNRLVKERGIGGVGRTGASLPKMTGWDAMELVSWILGDAVSAIERAGYGQARIVPASVEGPLLFILETQTNYVRGLKWWQEDGWKGHTISVQDWLTKGKRIPGVAHQRLIPASILSAPFQGPAIDAASLDHLAAATGGVRYQVGDGTDAEVTLIAGKWSALVQVTAAAIGRALIAPGAEMTADELVAWWSAYYAAMVAIETVHETPRPSTWERIKGGLKFSAKTTLGFMETEVADAAGRVAAVAAGTVGKAAGSAAKGFFDEAGMTAMVVTGIAIVVALR